MGFGRHSRFFYSSGSATDTGEATDPLISLGGSVPDPTGSGSTFDRLRGSEIYSAGVWAADLTDPMNGEIDVALANDNILARDDAVNGAWILCTEQHANDEPGFSASDDSRGSIARVVLLEPQGSETDNSVLSVQAGFDRRLLGLPQALDEVRICYPGNVFRNVTGAEARAGIVDYSMLYYYKFNSTDINDDEEHDDVQFWIEPIQSNGCKVEIITPDLILTVGTFANFPNVISDRFTSPFNDFFAVLLQNSFFDGGGGLRELPDQGIGNSNGFVGSSDLTSGSVAPIWLKRTIPPSTLPLDCAFVLRTTSEFSRSRFAPTVPIALGDYDKLNSGAVIAWDVAPPAERTISVIIDRRIFVGAGVRITATIVDGSGSPLPNRWFNLTASDGTITRDERAFSDAKGQLIAQFALPSTSVATQITFTATLVIDPAE